MGTRKLASLMREEKTDLYPSGIGWRRIAYTHAYSYEQALDKLLPKLSQHWGLPLDGKYVLVWGYAPKYEGVIDVSPAVVYRLKKNAERLAKKTAKRLAEQVTQ